MAHLYLRLVLFGLILIIAGCSHTSTIISDQHADEPREPEYTLIYYIHGDSEYLYHTENGNAAEADIQAHANAKEIARQAEAGEVFIFHQKPQKSLLGIFPKKTSEMIHFVQGEIVNHIRYRYGSGRDFLDLESELYTKYSSQNSGYNHRSYFIYFGHEIYDREGTNYHSSQPGVKVDTQTLTNGVQKFLSRDDSRFDLVVLSTCNNGTPAMARHFLPIAHFMLASPGNLHLSHIDTDPVISLEGNEKTLTRKTALAIAEKTFNRLDKSVHTKITLSLYDLDEVQNYIDELYESVQHYEKQYNLNPFRDNIDCAELPFFEENRFNRGVETWYRAATFGSKTKAQSHSGWGCKGL